MASIIKLLRKDAQLKLLNCWKGGYTFVKYFLTAVQ
jgi:hypothetical protein